MTGVLFLAGCGGARGEGVAVDPFSRSASASSHRSFCFFLPPRISYPTFSAHHGSSRPPFYLHKSRVPVLLWRSIVVNFVVLPL